MAHIGNNIKHLRMLKGVNQVSLSAGTGIKQSKISRVEAGGKLGHVDAVSIANYFGITTEMLLTKDLHEVFKSAEQLDAWNKKEKESKQAAKRHVSEVAASPMMIRALQRHYVKALSELTGKSTGEIQKEIEVIFQQLLLEHQQAVQGNAPDLEHP